MVTADRGYASNATYTALEEAGVEAGIPPQPEASPRTGMPLRRFAYDARHNRVRCPAGKHLLRRNQAQQGWSGSCLRERLSGLSSAGALLPRRHARGACALGRGTRRCSARWAAQRTGLFNTFAHAYRRHHGAGGRRAWGKPKVPRLAPGHAQQSGKHAHPRTYLTATESSTSSGWGPAACVAPGSRLLESHHCSRSPQTPSPLFGVRKGYHRPQTTPLR